MSRRSLQLVALAATIGSAVLATPSFAQSIDLRSGRYEPRSVAYSCGCEADYRYQERQEHRVETWTYSPPPAAYPPPAVYQPPAQPYGQCCVQGWGQPQAQPAAPPTSNWSYYQAGVSQWRPGVILPPDFRGYRYDGWTKKHLGAPGYGRAWYKIGNEFILADTATGEVRLIVTYP